MKKERQGFQSNKEVGSSKITLDTQEGVPREHISHHRMKEEGVAMAAGTRRGVVGLAHI